MNIYRRENNELVRLGSRRTIISQLYSPAYEYWTFYSPIINEILEKYKDVPLTPYIPTKAICESLIRNPEKAEFVPRWEVKGYDKEVSDERIERKLRDEFYQMYLDNRIEVVEFVCIYNPIYKAVP